MRELLEYAHGLLGQRSGQEIYARIGHNNNLTGSHMLMHVIGPLATKRNDINPSWLVVRPLRLPLRTLIVGP